MNKVLFIGINAKYIHSNLAIRYISKYIFEQGYSHEISMLEFSINQQVDYILDEIIKCSADTICFSTYLWNIEIIRKLTDAIKKVNETVKIVLGGPEVSYTPELELDNHKAVDYVVCGEGEVTMYELLTHLQNPTKSVNDLSKIHGIAYRNQDEVVVTEKRQGLNLSELPFPYEDLEGLEHRILYYETSRGCPFSCAYCLSSIEKGVRFKPIDMVYNELQFFLDHNVKQVKFVDRTFNARRQHAIDIMEYVIANDNGITNFHFEVAPELLTDDFIQCLRKARKGLFQLEVGIQSANEQTLTAISRRNDFQLIEKCIHDVKSLNNTHMHLDLIAGLPLESYEQFGHSFDYVYSLKPDQLQLGFLKVLKGSYLSQVSDKYNIKYRDYPPYEVLSTEVLSYEDISRLKAIEEMVELFYNSGQFTYIVDALEKEFDRAFLLYESMADYWIDKKMAGTNHSKQQLYQFVHNYILGNAFRGKYIQLLQFDYILNEKPKKKLEWMKFDFIKGSSQRAILDVIEEANVWPQVFGKYNTKQLGRMFHIDRVDESIIKVMNIKNKALQGISEDTKGLFIVINYLNRDFIHNNGEVVLVELSVKECENE